MKTLLYFIFVVALYAFSSCGKEFLDIKRNANQVVPQTIADYQAILDWNAVMNRTASFTLACLGTDEYYITDAVWNSISGANIYQKNGYIWAEDVYESSEAPDWNNAYQRILYANMALDVEKITPSAEEQEAWNTVKGQALFHRAWAFYQLAQSFCKPYNENTADTDLGIPIKLEYDVSVNVRRATLRETYDRILTDLHEALSLLPQVVLTNFKPSKAAANALLSRVYLETGDYGLCLQHATNVLGDVDGLLDYNTLDLTQYLAFSNYLNGEGNPEVIFYNHTASGTALGITRLLVDTALYAMYDDTDLRKRVYFDDAYQYTGRYSGGSNLFTGLAVDEILLNRAECLVRLGSYSDALADINKLLIHRYETGTFKQIIESNPRRLLNMVLTERRKELYMRGTRWMDLRRLNQYPDFATTLVRDINDSRYELPPGDDRWVWPIPDNEVILNGLRQNPR